VSLLEEIREVMTSGNAEKSAKLWGFDFGNIWPINEMKSSASEKVARWLQHRLD
jgi:hypothetical protein